MKYRVRERVQGDGTKLYDVQQKAEGFWSFIENWENIYCRFGLGSSSPKTLHDCLALIARFQQEDRDKAIKSTRYIASGLDIITYPQDNDKGKKPVAPGPVGIINDPAMGTWREGNNRMSPKMPTSMTSTFTVEMTPSQEEELRIQKEFLDPENRDWEYDAGGVRVFKGTRTPFTGDMK